MSLSCTVSEIWQDIDRKSPILTYHTCIWRHRLGWADGILPKYLASAN